MKNIFKFIILGLSFLFADKLAAQEIKGTPSIASYFAQGQCLDVKKADNTLIIYVCNGKENQNLRFVTENGGQIILGNMQSDKCLTSDRKGDPITTKKCGKSKSQKWSFEENGTLKNGEGHCLDILNFGKKPGTGVIAWDCTATENQKFYPAIATPTVAMGEGVAQIVTTNVGTKAITFKPEFFMGNMAGSGGRVLEVNEDKSIKGANNGQIVFGGAGVLNVKFEGGLAGRAIGEAMKEGKTKILPPNFDFFIGEKAGLFIIE